MPTENSEYIHSASFRDYPGASKLQQQLPEQLREQFIGWQCRIRQFSVRKHGGRPSTAMQPALELANQVAGPVNVQIVKQDSEEVTREFRFMVQKTEDSQARYENAIRYLAEYYYQIPDEFDEELTAVYAIDSNIAQQIVDIGQCILHFDQGNQLYDLQCTARFLDQQDAKYQATYWHNHLFNPTMPGLVRIIGFTPDWALSSFRTSR